MKSVFTLHFHEEVALRFDTFSALRFYGGVAPPFKGSESYVLREERGVGECKRNTEFFLALECSLEVFYEDMRGKSFSWRGRELCPLFLICIKSLVLEFCWVLYRSG